MGFSLNGACYKDSAEALLHWKNLYPQADGSHIVTEVASSVTVGGVLSYSLESRSLDSNALSSRIGTVAMRTCDYNDVTLGADYGFSVFIGCAIMFALGFIGTR